MAGHVEPYQLNRYFTFLTQLSYSYRIYLFKKDTVIILTKPTKKYFN